MAKVPFSNPGKGGIKSKSGGNRPGTLGVANKGQGVKIKGSSEKQQVTSKNGRGSKSVTGGKSRGNWS